MKQIRNILLDLEDNEDRQAFIAEVTTVAKDAGAQVTLLSVQDTPPDHHEKHAELSDLQQWMKEDRLEQIQSISSAFEQERNSGVGQTIQWQTLSGKYS